MLPKQILSDIIWLGVIAVLLIIFGIVDIAQAGSLETLERERARAVATMLSAEVSPEERQEALQASQHRLVDLERMVLRDDSLLGHNTPVVRQAFDDYDVTFLVHAATEKDAGLTPHLLDSFGLSTDALMGARMGRR